MRGFAVRCLCSILGMGLSRNSGLGKGRPGCEDGAVVGLLSHLCSDNIQPRGALEVRCSDIKREGPFLVASSKRGELNPPGTFPPLPALGLGGGGDALDRTHGSGGRGVPASLLPLSSALVRPNPQSCIQLWAPPGGKGNLI